MLIFIQDSSKILPAELEPSDSYTRFQFQMRGGRQNRSCCWADRPPQSFSRDLGRGTAHPCEGAGGAWVHERRLQLGRAGLNLREPSFLFLVQLYESQFCTFYLLCTLSVLNFRFSCKMGIKN